MRRVIAIDPGVNECGFASFEVLGLGPPELMWAGLVTPDTACEDIGVYKRSTKEPDVLDVYSEFPRIYPKGAQRKGDLNDLLNLAAVVGRFEQVDPFLVRVFPAEWKGQTPKKIMVNRIRGKLSERELARVGNYGAKEHNVWDAVGIGLWALGRLK